LTVFGVNVIPTDDGAGARRAKGSPADRAAINPSRTGQERSPGREWRVPVAKLSVGVTLPTSNA
jgi:hypothetical protein